MAEIGNRAPFYIDLRVNQQSLRSLQSNISSAISRGVTDGFSRATRGAGESAIKKEGSRINNLISAGVGGSIAGKFASKGITPAMRVGFKASTEAIEKRTTELLERISKMAPPGEKIRLSQLSGGMGFNQDRIAKLGKAIEKRTKEASAFSNLADRIFNKLPKGAKRALTAVSKITERIFNKLPSGAKSAANSIFNLAQSFGIAGAKARALAIGIGFVIAASIGIGAAAKKFGDFNEELNKANVLFREANHLALGFSNTIAKTFGISKTESLKLIGDIQNTLVPFVTKKAMENPVYNPDGEKSIRKFAAKKSLPLARRVMDITSLRNLEVGDVNTLLTSAIIRGGRAAQSLGAAMSQVDVEALALEMSGKRRHKDLTVEEKQYARIKIIMDRTADAEGDRFRTIGSINNAARHLGGTLQNTAIEMGRIFDAVDIGGQTLVQSNILQGFNALLSVIGDLSQKIKPLSREVNDLINILLTNAPVKLGEYFDWIESGIADDSGRISGFDKLKKNVGGSANDLAMGLGELFGKDWDLTKFDERKIERLTKKYEDAFAKVKALNEEQEADPNIDNSSKIRGAEAWARYWANKLENMGQPVLMEDTMKGLGNLNEELEETDKLTGSIHNNLLKIGEDMQESLFGSDFTKEIDRYNFTKIGSKFNFTDMINMAGKNLKEFFNLNSTSSTSTDVTSTDSSTILTKIAEEAVKQNIVLQEMLIEARRGVFA